MMKNYILLIVSFFSLTLSAQFSWKLKSYDDPAWKNFKDSVTYVVWDSNSVLKASVEKYWTVTKYKFISPEEFFQLSKDPHNVFLRKVYLHKFKSQNGGGTIDYYQDHLVVFNGRKSGYKYKKNETINIGVLESLYDFPYTDALQTSVYIKYMNNVYDVFQKNKITSNSAYDKYLDAQAVHVSDKALYIKNDDFSDNFKEADIRKMYPGELKVIDMTQFFELMKNPIDVNFVSVEYAWTGKKLVMVMNVQTGALLYYDFYPSQSKYELLEKHVKAWIKK